MYMHVDSGVPTCTCMSTSSGGPTCTCISCITLLIQAFVCVNAGIQRLVLAGRMGEAIDATYELYPGILETKPDLLFKLKCRQFIEMVNGTDSQVRPSICTPKSPGALSPNMSPLHHQHHGSGGAGGGLLSPKHGGSSSGSSSSTAHLVINSPSYNSDSSRHRSSIAGAHSSHFGTSNSPYLRPGGGSPARSPAHVAANSGAGSGDAPMFMSQNMHIIPPSTTSGGVGGNSNKTTPATSTSSSTNSLTSSSSSSSMSLPIGVTMSQFIEEHMNNVNSALNGQPTSSTSQLTRGSSTSPYHSPKLPQNTAADERMDTNEQVIVASSGSAHENGVSNGVSLNGVSQSSAGKYPTVDTTQDNDMGMPR